MTDKPMLSVELDAALAREAALREELTTAKRAVPHTAGGGISQRDFDYDRGFSAGSAEVETFRIEREALQQRLTVAEQRASMLEREFKKLRDVAHDCYEIASSYSGCIDGVEEHGGDDHEDPSCAIFHRLYYAMFDADRALKPAAEGEGS